MVHCILWTPKEGDYGASFILTVACSVLQQLFLLIINRIILFRSVVDYKKINKILFYQLFLVN